MKRFLPLLLLLAAPASADIAIKHTASTSLKVDGAAVQAISCLLYTSDAADE